MYRRRVCLIGTNGFLAQALGKYGNSNDLELMVVGRSVPNNYHAKTFYRSNLCLDDFPFEACLNNDLIIYTAAKGVQSGAPVKAEDVFYVNTYFPILLLEKLRESGYRGKFVSFGSYFEIGFNEEKKSFTEEEIITSSLNVPNSYCVSKRLLSRYVSSANLMFDYFHFILPTIYGEKESGNRLLPYLISSISKGQPVKLTSGEQIRQYIYIDDVARLLFDSLVYLQLPGIYNFPFAETLSIKELALNIFKYFDIEADKDVFGATLRSDVGMKNLELDTSKFKKYYNKIPNLYTIEEIIPRYINNGLK